VEVTIQNPFNPLELGWHHLTASDLNSASLLARCLFWLLHASEYDAETLKRLFPEPGFWQATETTHGFPGLPRTKPCAIHEKSDSRPAVDPQFSPQGRI